MKCECIITNSANSTAIQHSFNQISINSFSIPAGNWWIEINEFDELN